MARVGSSRATINNPGTRLVRASCGVPGPTGWRSLSRTMGSSHLLLLRKTHLPVAVRSGHPVFFYLAKENLLQARGTVLA